MWFWPIYFQKLKRFHQFFKKSFKKIIIFTIHEKDTKLSNIVNKSENLFFFKSENFENNCLSPKQNVILLVLLIEGISLQPERSTLFQNPGGSNLSVKCKLGVVAVAGWYFSFVI